MVWYVLGMYLNLNQLLGNAQIMQWKQIFYAELLVIIRGKKT